MLRRDYESQPEPMLPETAVPDERTPEGGSPSTAREVAAKAFLEEFRTDFERALVENAAGCFERGEDARSAISFAAGQWLSFDQVPSDIQNVVLKSAQWLQTNLTDALEEWRGTFLTRFQPLGESLCDIHPEMGWIGAQVDAARTTSEGKNQVWLMIATDGTAGFNAFAAKEDWLAPGWMEGWPGVASSAGSLMEARLNRKQSDEVFQAFGDRVRKSFTLAQESAKNRAQILIAKREARSPGARALPVKSGARLPRLEKLRMGAFRGRIAELMLKNPDKSHREILGMIDTEYANRYRDIPKRFKKHKHKRRGIVMVGAYDCGECGHSVENFMSAIRKPLGLDRAPKSRR